MNNKKQIILTSNPPANGPAATITQNGDKNTVVAHANTVNNNMTFILPPMQSIAPNTSSLTVNRDYYNLFVIGDEDFCNNHFIVPKDRTLTECISDEIKAEFASITEEAIAKIKTFPSVFASENHQYGGRTDAEHKAIFGFVTDIKVQENGIKIYLYQLNYIQQQSLNELAFNLAIQGAPMLTELNRTHWTIKKINLIEELKDAGISVFAPT